MRRVIAICNLISLYAHLCAGTSVGLLDMWQRFMPSATFLLRSGAAAQRFMLQEVQRGAAAPRWLSATVVAQLAALDMWQLTVCSLAGAASGAAASDAIAALVQACAPPTLLREWLQCTLTSLQLLEPPSWKPGGQACGLQGAQSNKVAKPVAFV